MAASTQLEHGEETAVAWAAVGIGEAFVAGAGIVALLAVTSEIGSCFSLGCSTEASDIGAGTVAMLFAAALLLVLGLGWSAYASGRSLRDAAVRGALATLVAGVTLVVLWAPFGADWFALAFVLAIGIAASLCVRKPIAAARYLRVGAMAFLAVATLVDDSLALVVLALLVFPAIGMADTVALGLAGDRER